MSVSAVDAFAICFHLSVGKGHLNFPKLRCLDHCACNKSRRSQVGRYIIMRKLPCCTYSEPSYSRSKHASLWRRRVPEKESTATLGRKTQDFGGQGASLGSPVLVIFTNTAP